MQYLTVMFSFICLPYPIFALYVNIILIVLPSQLKKKNQHLIWNLIGPNTSGDFMDSDFDFKLILIFGGVFYWLVKTDPILTRVHDLLESFPAQRS